MAKNGQKPKNANFGENTQNLRKRAICEKHTLEAQQFNDFGRYSWESHIFLQILHNCATDLH